jgi:hypothetical protein
MVVDPTSMAAWSCLVVVGESSVPLPPAVSWWWPTSVLGVVADNSSAGLWLVAASSSADEVNRWAAAGVDLPN